MVNEVGDKGSKPPVVATVLQRQIYKLHTNISYTSYHLEQVTQRHGGMGETVNKQCFKQPLDVVKAPACHSNTK